MHIGCGKRVANVCFKKNKIHGLQDDENLNTNYGRLFAHL
jgi:hypothetical protein